MRKIFFPITITVVSLLFLLILFEEITFAGKTHIVWGIVKNRDGSLTTSNSEIKVIGWLLEYPDDKISVFARNKGIWMINVGNHEKSWKVGDMYHLVFKNVNSDSSFFGDKTEKQIELTNGGVDFVEENTSPLELLYFTALTDDTKVTLKWKTSSEDRNVGFYVYRSETENGKFQKISKLIEGTGNSAMGSDYEHIDKRVDSDKTYFYYLEDIDIHGVRNRSDMIKVTIPKPLPKEYKLLQNYPNPFNPETWIPYQLAADSQVTIQIYDIVGELVREINLGEKQRDYYIGKHKAAYWDGKNDQGESVASGIYFYRIKASSFTNIRRMIIIK